MLTPFHLNVQAYFPMPYPNFNRLLHMDVHFKME